MNMFCCREAKGFINLERTADGWALRGTPVYWCPFCGTRLPGAYPPDDVSEPVGVDVRIQPDTDTDAPSRERRDAAAQVLAEIIRDVGQDFVQVMKDANIPGLERRLVVLVWPERLEREQARKS